MIYLVVAIFVGIGICIAGCVMIMFNDVRREMNCEVFCDRNGKPNIILEGNILECVTKKKRMN